MTSIYTLIAVFTVGLNINYAALDASALIASRGAVPYSSSKETNLNHGAIDLYKTSEEEEPHVYMRSDLSTLSETDRYAKSDNIVLPLLLNKVQRNGLYGNNSDRADILGPLITGISSSFHEFSSSVLMLFEALDEEPVESEKEDDTLNQGLNSSYEELEEYYPGKFGGDSSDHADASSPSISRTSSFFSELPSSMLMSFEAFDEEPVESEKECDTLNQSLGNSYSFASNTVRFSTLPSFAENVRSSAAGRAGTLSQSQSVASFSDGLSLDNKNSKMEVSGCLLGLSFEGLMSRGNSQRLNRLGAGDLIEEDMEPEMEPPLMFRLPAASTSALSGLSEELITVTFANSNRKVTVARSTIKTTNNQSSMTPLNSVCRPFSLSDGRNEKSRLREVALNYLTPIQFDMNPRSKVERVRLNLAPKYN